jgi:hypothetical protein
MAVAHKQQAAVYRMSCAVLFSTLLVFFGGRNAESCRAIFRGCRFGLRHKTLLLKIPALKAFADRKPEVKNLLSHNRLIDQCLTLDQALCPTGVCQLIHCRTHFFARQRTLVFVSNIFFVRKIFT